jgi:nucleoside-diphosphate-sugar epimerase
VARVLIVGCGCRGRALATALHGDGHAVRGTTRDPSRIGEIEASGVEAAVADPDRLATLMPLLEAVAAICWLMGSATGEAVTALHGPRLRTLLERLVDTPVRGLVYEAAGSVEHRWLRDGAEIARAAAATWRMPVEVVEDGHDDWGGWVDATAGAVARVLA